jgi:hypothetical protein
MDAEQHLLAVVYLPAGRVAQHLPLPPGDDGQPLTPEAWALQLLADVPAEGAMVAIVDDDAGLCGPATPPDDAVHLTR